MLEKYKETMSEMFWLNDPTLCLMEQVKNKVDQITEENIEETYNFFKETGFIPEETTATIEKTETTETSSDKIKKIDEYQLIKFSSLIDLLIQYGEIRFRKTKIILFFIEKFIKPNPYFKKSLKYVRDRSYDNFFYHVLVQKGILLSKAECKVNDDIEVNKNNETNDDNENSDENFQFYAKLYDIIYNDNVDELINIVNFNKIHINSQDFGSYITQYHFTGNRSSRDDGFVGNFKRWTLISLAAFLSSMKCFKFLLLNKSEGTIKDDINDYYRDDILMDSAVAGGNPEIIRILQHNGYHFDISGSVIVAMIYHHDSIFDWFYEEYKKKKSKRPFRFCKSFIDEAVCCLFYRYLMKQLKVDKIVKIYDSLLFNRSFLLINFLLDNFVDYILLDFSKKNDYRRDEKMDYFQHFFNHKVPKMILNKMLDKIATVHHLFVNSICNYAIENEQVDIFKKCIELPIFQNNDYFFNNELILPPIFAAFYYIADQKKKSQMKTNKIKELRWKSNRKEIKNPYYFFEEIMKNHSIDINFKIKFQDGQNIMKDYCLLSESIVMNDLELFETLISLPSIDLNLEYSEDDGHFYPTYSLMDLVVNNKIEFIQKILQKRSLNVNKISGEITPIVAAAILGFSEIAREILFNDPFHRVDINLICYKYENERLFLQNFIHSLSKYEWFRDNKRTRTTLVEEFEANKWDVWDLCSLQKKKKKRNKITC